jgi:PilZ domain
MPRSTADIRRSKRHLTFRTGKIVCSDGTISFDCAVLNISDHGACILVPVGATVPESFTLHVDHEKPVRECKLAWREGARIGASFS